MFFPIVLLLIANTSTTAKQNRNYDGKYLFFHIIQYLLFPEFLLITSWLYTSLIAAIRRLSSKSFNFSYMTTSYSKRQILCFKFYPESHTTYYSYRRGSKYHWYNQIWPIRATSFVSTITNNKTVSLQWSWRWKSSQRCHSCDYP